MLTGKPDGAAPMWRFCFCVVALLAVPALAQTLRYDEDHSLPQHRSEGNHTDPHLHARRHPRRLSFEAIEPSRLGPPPTGFWYRCDAPAGHYPYIPACRTPWQLVPSGTPR